jgi:hypothetical protein
LAVLRACAARGKENRAVTDIEQLESLRDKLIEERRKIAKEWDRIDPRVVGERVQKMQEIIRTVEDAIEHERSLAPRAARPGI